MTMPNAGCKGVHAASVLAASVHAAPVLWASVLWAPVLRALALVLGLSLLFPLASEVRAERLETEYYSVDLPDTWQKLQDNITDNLTITVFTTKNRDSTLTTIVGRTGGAALETIGESFARQYHAKTRFAVKNKVGTFTYEDSKNEEGLALVSTLDNLYMVVTMTGNLRKARNLLKTFSSGKDYPGLVPTF